MGERKPNLTYFLILVFSIIFILQLYYLYVYGEDFLNDIFYSASVMNFSAHAHETGPGFLEHLHREFVRIGSSPCAFSSRVS